VVAFTLTAGHPRENGGLAARTRAKSWVAVSRVKPHQWSLHANPLVCTVFVLLENPRRRRGGFGRHAPGFHAGGIARCLLFSVR